MTIALSGAITPFDLMGAAGRSSLRRQKCTVGLLVGIMRLDHEPNKVQHHNFFRNCFYPSTMNRELKGKPAAPAALGEGLMVPAIAFILGNDSSNWAQIASQICCGA